MTAAGGAQLVLYFVVLLGLAWPVGRYVARVLNGEPTWLSNALGDFEHFLYRISGVHAEREMSWRAYAVAYLAFNLVGLLATYAMLRLETFLPFHQADIGPISPHLAFNTAVSFATNTNWQSYAGESTLTPFVQMLALTTQNFVSAAAGIAMMAALVRGLPPRAGAQTVGNLGRPHAHGSMCRCRCRSCWRSCSSRKAWCSDYQPAAHVTLLEARKQRAPSR